VGKEEGRDGGTRRATKRRVTSVRRIRAGDRICPVGYALALQDEWPKNPEALWPPSQGLAPVTPTA